MPDGSRVANLFAQMCGDDHAATLTSKRELWSIVRRAGRPGASKEKSAVVSQLIVLLAKDGPSARRELLWMLSEIGGDESVGPIAALLLDRELRDDARMALQRIPGGKSLAALEGGLAAAPNDFKINIAQSLRARGVTLPGHPCQKMVPTKPTSVKAIQ
jgi:hypothetical protein